MSPIARVAAWCRPLVLIAAAAPVLAQSGVAAIAGFVRDTGGNPLELVHFSSSGLYARSDTAGRFSLGGLPSGRAVLLVRRLGFAPQNVPLNLMGGRTDSINVVLQILPQTLAAINSLGDESRLREFYRHRQGGSGYYIDRQEIEARKSPRTSDLLRRLPGIRFVNDRTGRPQLRMGRAYGGRDCPPDVWVDGVRAPFMGVDDIPLMDVEALEIYRGPSGLPPEFNGRLGNPACGTVVIWTRVPG